ncbi:hypothetical protein Syun_031494 [Stephania yunnanensis]|uniref:Phytocyanin domain-containing protein n=1 Tax=Stephania yunnanensis TaxID=152371 RepID=A0AAP0HGP4_9MAGN
MEGWVMRRSMSRSGPCHRLGSSASTLLLIIMIFFSGSEAYKNYTVGDSLGWYDHFHKSSSSSSSSVVISYQKWAAGKTFALGDFLIFNTDTNHSVVQTYNFTTYKRCDFEDAETDDTTEWSAAHADPSSTTPQQVTIPVPLLKEGINYFFSGDYDGEQCKNGQHFKINVTHGQGLPPSLQSSSSFAPSPSVDPTDGVGDDNVSSAFDHPKSAADHQADDDKTSTAASASLSGLYVILLGLTLGHLILTTY